MDFTLSEEQVAIRAAIEKICAGFDAEYWLKKDGDGGFPDDFHKAFARDGWLGIAMPEQYGGAGLGYLADGWLKSSPWGMVVGLCLGAAAGFWNAYKFVLKNERP